MTGMQTYLWTMNANPVGINSQTLQTISAGTYMVTVTSPSGCVGRDTLLLTIKDPIVDLGNNYTICANEGHPLLNAGNPGCTYSWTLNGSPIGGNTQTLQTSAAGIYKVKVTSSAGCTAKDSVTLNILPLLNGAFTAPATATVGATVSFTDNSTPSPTAWNWNFGDGSANSSIQNPTHTYTVAGQYAIFLIVHNATCSDTVTSLITIQNNCATFGLTASYTTSADTIYLNGLGMVTFTNTSANSDAWLWDFGDGTTSTLQNPTHVYDVIGTYTVTLTSYNHNCSASITSIVVVKQSSVGINDLSISDYKLQIYPNPNDGKFTLQIENCPECMQQIEDITILNILGKEVFHTSDIVGQSMLVDLSKNPKGIYFVKLLISDHHLSVANSKGVINSFENILIKKVIVN
jgi:PKD repeat protein